MKSILVRVLAAASVTAAAVTGAALPADAATGFVHFSKVYYNSPGSDRGSNKSLNAEWVRVKNTTSKTKILTGWTIRDRSHHVYKFPKFTLKPGKSVTLHTGKGKNTKSNLYWGSSWYIWNNGGDKATLKNASGTTKDTCKWSGGGAWKTC